MLCKLVYLINDLSGHGETCPITTVNVAPCVKVNKVVSHLSVTSGVSGHSTDGTCGHAAVLFFVGLHVLTKLHVKKSLEVEFVVKKEF